MALNCQKQQQLAEYFVTPIDSAAEPHVPEPEIKQQQPISPNIPGALVEMAAGAAHELNNPLSVISGRAQLLAEKEDDAEKKQILQQIQANAAELSGIIDGLMSFASPEPPKPTLTSVQQILTEAAQLAAQKADVEQPDVQTEVDDSVSDVFVDSAQIVSAIANVFTNSIESYPDGPGPINVIAEADTSAAFVKLQISDQGRGMDAETLQKATQPFFSARGAGRKRGMGLAYADRLIQSNRGLMDISSEPGSGTTVTIMLPVA